MARGHLPVINIFQQLLHEEMKVVTKNGLKYPQFTVVGNLICLPTTYGNFASIPIFWSPGPTYK